MSVSPPGQPGSQDQQRQDDPPGASVLEEGIGGAIEASGLVDGAIAGIGNLFGSIGSAAGDAASAVGNAVAALIPDGNDSDGPAGDAAAGPVSDAAVDAAAGSVSDAAVDAAGAVGGSILDLFS
ncbi:hypothetical protein [Phreatobacter sp.]|uniref:hypothetical protein n=1 Tax=Phreatobacter sp. TaxID=1966341 RepID=UPI003F6FB42E